MITNINARAYGSTYNSTLIRQRVATRPVMPTSMNELRKPLSFIAVAAIVIAVCISQVISWQVGRTKETLGLLQTERSTLADENVRLRAQRAQLMSEKHIQAVAGARLDLFLPGDKQVHRM